MSNEPFKLTEEMITEIEAKVNTVMEAVHSGMKDRLIESGCYTEFASVAACEIHIKLENEEVIVTPPIGLSDDDKEYDNDSDDPDLWE